MAGMLILARNWDCMKSVTHGAILYADRGDRRTLPGVPSAAMAIFADRRIKSPISGMSRGGGAQDSRTFFFQSFPKI